jgi:hypothetical protein
MAKFAPAVEVAARLRKLITGQGIPIPTRSRAGDLRQISTT